MKNELSLLLKLYSNPYGTSLHQAAMFYFTAKCLVSFCFVFVILHKIVVLNNVQQCIKQAKSFCAFALIPVSHVTQPSHLLLVLAHGGMDETF